MLGSSYRREWFGVNVYSTQGDTRNIHTILIGKYETKRPHERSRRECEDDITGFWLMLRGGIVQSGYETAAIFWSIMRPHPSPNNSWVTHHSCLVGAETPGSCLACFLSRSDPVLLTFLLSSWMSFMLGTVFPGILRRNIVVHFVTEPPFTYDSYKEPHCWRVCPIISTLTTITVLNTFITLLHCCLNNFSCSCW
jgi:hypothetical protein